jgi:hypothetical protein
MRSLMVLILLVVQPSRAAECLPIGSDLSLVLRGVVEYKVETVGRPRAISLFLHLPLPICVQGSKYDGRPFKKENLTLVLLDIPAKLSKGVREGRSVTLRGAFRGPAGNDPSEKLTFAVAEVM